MSGQVRSGRVKCYYHIIITLQRCHHFKDAHPGTSMDNEKQQQESNKPTKKKTIYNNKLPTYLQTYTQT